METILKGCGSEVTIGDDHPTVLIGERINPTGKPILAEAMKAGNMDVVLREALDQLEVGASVLDVNAGVPGEDEAALLSRMVEVIQENIEVPLCIDSRSPEALEAGLKVCSGKALINSVNGEEQVLEQVLPLVKRYDAAVIGLTMDDDGIPATAEGRLRVAKKIVDRAAALGIPSNDIVIDCLAMSMGADFRSGLVALEAIRLIREELGVNMTLGASNISFGLPNRELVNRTFLAMAIAAGVNCPIVDAAQAQPTALTADLTMGRDNYAKRYTGWYRKSVKAAK